MNIWSRKVSRDSSNIINEVIQTIPLIPRTDKFKRTIDLIVFILYNVSK